MAVSPVSRSSRTGLARPVAAAAFTWIVSLNGYLCGPSFHTLGVQSLHKCGRAVVPAKLSQAAWIKPISARRRSIPSGYVGLTTVAGHKSGNDVTTESNIFEEGVQVAVTKGLIEKDVESEPVSEIITAGSAADECAMKILSKLENAPSEGYIVTLQGPPSDEKSAVIKELQKRASKIQVWRMDTFFRAMTFMLSTYVEQTGKTMDDALRPEMLAAGIEMIEEMIEGKSIESMLLESERMFLQDNPSVDESTPVVVKQGHGEVINFVNGALSKLRGSGAIILIDGHKSTLDYIRTPYRFDLH